MALGEGLSPARPIADPDLVPIENHQISPAVAFDGTNFRTVWVETLHHWQGGELYTSRIAADGSLLDGRGTLLPTRDQVSSPQIQFNGVTFLVTWIESDDHQNPNHRLVAVSLSRDGQILSSEPLVLTQDIASRPELIWDGREFVLLWSEGMRSGHATVMAWIRASGSLRDQRNLAVPLRHGPQSMASSGAGYLVVRPFYHYVPCAFLCAPRDVDVQGYLLDQDGGVLKELTIANGLPLSAGSMDVAFNGMEYLVIWGGLHARRVSTAGDFLSPIFEIAPGGENPSLIWDGNLWVTTWTKLFGYKVAGLYISRITAAGLPLEWAGTGAIGLRVRFTEEADFSPSLSTGRGSTLVVYKERQSAERVKGRFYRSQEASSIPHSDLLLVRTLAPSSPRARADLTLQLVVLNQGRFESPDSEVMLNESLINPQLSKLSSLQTTRGTCQLAPQVGCQLGNLPVGEAAVVTVVLSPVSSGSIYLAARASGGNPDQDIENNVVAEHIFIDVCAGCLKVASMEPNHGPSSGGTIVTIRGEGFQSTTRVYFGEVQGSVLQVTPTEIRILSPPHQVGGASVRLNDSGSNSSAFASIFHYEHVPSRRRGVVR